MNEHKSVLAQMSDDGAARSSSALTRVTIFEAALVIRELELDSISQSGRGTFSFTQEKKIAEVARAVRPCSMAGKFLSPRDLKHSVEVITCRFSPVRQMPAATYKVVVRRFQATACFQPWQIADGRSERSTCKCARCRRKLRRKKARKIAAHADDQLPPALLRHAKSKRISYLCDYAVAKQPGLVLHASEVLAASRGLNAKDVLHHENAGLKMSDVL